MKYIFLIAASFVAVPVFSQDLKSAPKEINPAIVEVVIPDISKLHPIKTKDRYMVVREGAAIWVKEEQAGDLEILVERSYSVAVGASSEDVALIYPLGRETPCGIFLKKDDAFVYALILENGKAITTNDGNGRVVIQGITDSNDFIIGASVSLYTRDIKILIEKREFLIAEKI